MTGLVVCVSIAIFNTLQKSLVQDASPIDVAYYTNVIAFIILLPIALYTSQVSDISLTVIGLVFATGLFNAISFYFWPVALSKEDLGVIAPTRGITPITVAVLEPILFLNLDYSFELLLASLLAGFGLYIAFSENGILTPIKRIQSVGILFGLGSAIAITGAVLVDRFAVFSANVPPILYACGLAMSTSVLLGLFRVYKKEENSFVPTKKYIPVGIFRAIIVGFAVFTLSITTGTQYNILIQLSIPFSVLLGYLFLQERDFTIRQLIGSGIIIVGIYLIL